MYRCEGEQVAIYTEPAAGWILRRAAEELHRGLPGSVLYDLNTPLDEVVPREVNYFINYAVFDRFESLVKNTGLVGGMFTHREETGPYAKVFDRLAAAFDFHVAQNRQTMSALMGLAKPFPGRLPIIRVIRLGYDPRVKKEPVFGVVGRVYKSGRKGEALIEELEATRKYTIYCWGKGWPCREMFPGSPWESLPEFYRAIDYLIVPALVEGGPVSLIDAMAAGVPVIAPKSVGWCSEFPVIEYTRGDFNSLDQTMAQLAFPPSWEEWVDQHCDMFAQCLQMAQDEKVAT